MPARVRLMGLVAIATMLQHQCFDSSLLLWRLSLTTLGSRFVEIAAALVLQQ
jgi:hypothetical protein